MGNGGARQECAVHYGNAVGLAVVQQKLPQARKITRRGVQTAISQGLTGSVRVPGGVGFSSQRAPQVFSGQIGQFPTRSGLQAQGKQLGASALVFVLGSGVAHFNFVQGLLHAVSVVGPGGDAKGLLVVFAPVEVSGHFGQVAQGEPVCSGALDPREVALGWGFPAGDFAALDGYLRQQNHHRLSHGEGIGSGFCRNVFKISFVAHGIALHHQKCSGADAVQGGAQGGRRFPALVV